MRFHLPSFVELTAADISDLTSQIHALNSPWKAPHQYMNINPPLVAKAHDDAANPPATLRDILQHLLQKLENAGAFLKRGHDDQAYAIVDGVKFSLQLARSIPPL